MLVQPTLDKLREMKMTAMADSYRFQLEDPAMKNLSFDERFGLLVDIEYTSRQNSHLQRLISNAEFDKPQATILGVNYESGRKLDRELIHNLATCAYITEKRNIIITGATGCGKTYLACAFGMEACKMFYTTRYVRLPDLLLELKIARDGNTYKKVIQKYSKPSLLILDEWLLIKCNQEAQYDLMELIHHRTKSGSNIFCSQFRVSGWYDQLGGSASTLADAILDRIVHTSYEINIQALDPSRDISMREIYGLKQK